MTCLSQGGVESVHAHWTMCFPRHRRCVLAMSASMGQPSAKGWVGEQIADPFAKLPMWLLHTQSWQPSVGVSPCLSLHGSQPHL